MGVTEGMISLGGQRILKVVKCEYDSVVTFIIKE